MRGAHTRARARAPVCVSECQSVLRVGETHLTQTVGGTDRRRRTRRRGGGGGGGIRTPRRVGPDIIILYYILLLLLYVCVRRRRDGAGRGGQTGTGESAEHWMEDGARACARTNNGNGMRAATATLDPTCTKSVRFEFSPTPMQARARVCVQKRIRTKSVRHLDDINNTVRSPPEITRRAYARLSSSSRPRSELTMCYNIVKAVSRKNASAGTSPYRTYVGETRLLERQTGEGLSSKI